MHEQPVPQEPTAEEIDLMHRRMLAGQLVGLRIVLRMSLRDVAARLYYHYDTWNRRKSRWLHPTWWRMWLKAPRQMRKLEAELPDAHLSTIQRYARIVGLSVRTDLVKPRKQRPKLTLSVRARAIRKRRRRAGRVSTRVV